ncbi:MAG: SRPBCC family protein [Vicinamibacterales bacterium]
MTQAAPFSISRVFAAPRSLVYEVHTKPEHLGRWLGPAGFETISCTLDFRVGGHYHYGLRGPQGMEMWGRQTYLEIVPGERLVYLQSFSTPDGSVARHPMSPTWPLEMHATVTFEDAAPGQTRVTVSWQPHNSDAEGNAAFDGARAGMTGGFTGTFARLDEYLATILPQGDVTDDVVSEPTATTLRFTRRLQAPRSLVWKAHTEADRLVKWWGPEGFTITIHDIDVKTGGVWRLTMHGPDGVNYPNRILYREVVEPSLLDYDHGDFERTLFRVRTS